MVWTHEPRNLKRLQQKEVTDIVCLTDLEFATDLSDRASEKISGAAANPANNGNASNAPGQATAAENAQAVLDKQIAKFGLNQLDNGVKAGFSAPTNSNHFFQEQGVIGNQ